MSVSSVNWLLTSKQARAGKAISLETDNIWSVYRQIGEARAREDIYLSEHGWGLLPCVFVPVGGVRGDGSPGKNIA